MRGGEKELEQKTSAEPREYYGAPTSHRGGRRDKMESMNKALEEVVQTLLSCLGVVFSQETPEGKKNFCSLYCCNCPEGKDVYGVMPGKIVKMTCVRCKSFMEYIKGMFHRTERTMNMTAFYRLAVEKLKDKTGGCRHVEVSEAMQMELKTQSISARRTVF